MSKVIFFALPYTGHMNGSFPLIRELTARGERVIVYSHERFAEQVEAANAELRCYRVPNPEGGPTRLMQLVDRVTKVAEHVLEDELPRVRNDNPDYLIYDSIAVWGHYIARILGIPAVRSNLLPVLNKAMMRRGLKQYRFFELLPIFAKNLADRPRAKRRIKRIRAQYNFPDLQLLDGLIYQNDLNIVHYSSTFHPCSETFGENHHFVGSSIWERPEDSGSFPWERVGTGPIVYISLGTVYGDRDDFYETCFRALGSVGAQVILAAGGKSDSDLTMRPPSNFLVVPFAPQLAVLKRAAAFVSHAGTNGMAEAAGLGVPTILAPQNGEQRITAAHFEELGAGIVLRGKITEKKLRRAVEAVLQDSSYRENTVRIGESLRSAGGAQRAVDEIFRWKPKEAAIA